MWGTWFDVSSHLHLSHIHFLLPLIFWVFFVVVVVLGLFFDCLFVFVVVVGFF